ncbi:MAG: chromatin modification- protein VID21 [Caeruleum heppii]|nr:MAG: chromatin modification- protein VID21 [Caeruleum heppii]
MTLDVLREREAILRSKRAELTSTVLSRKRKLRELYTVARCTEPVPTLSGLALNDPIDDGEASFLNANDILKGRIFNELTLPTRAPCALNLTSPSRQSPITPPIISDLPKPYSNLSTADRSRRLSPTRTEDGISRPKGSPSHFDAHSTSQSPVKGIREDHPAPGGYTNTGLTGLDAARPSRATQSRSLDQASAGGETLHLTGQVLPHPDRNSAVESAGASPNREALVAEDPHRSPGKHLYPPIPDLSPNTLGQSASDRGANVADKAHISIPDPASRTVRSSPLQENAHSQQRFTGLNGHGYNRLGPDGRDHESALSLTVPAAEATSSPTSTVGPFSQKTPGTATSTDTSPDNEQMPEDAQSTSEKRHPAYGPSVARHDVVSRSPSTPDGQLQLEEQQAKRDPSAHMPVHDTQLVGGESLSGQAHLSTKPLDSIDVVPADRTRLDRDAAVPVEDDDDEVIGVPTPAHQLMPVNQTNVKAVSPRALFSNDQTPVSGDHSIATGAPDRKNPIDRHNHSASTPISVGTSINIQASSDTKAEPPVPSSNREGLVTQDVDMVDGDSPEEAKDRTTSTKTSYSPVAVQSPPERMTTRVSSGAIRHKSVSEILGEVPRPSIPQTEAAAHPTALTEGSRQLPNVVQPVNGETALVGDVQSHRSERRDRGKLPTVVFAKQQPRSAAESTSLVNRKPHNAGSVDMPEEQRYLLALWAVQATSLAHSQPLGSLLSTANKTLTTASAFVDLHEQQDVRILRRIDQLQSANKWSFRQLKRVPEPVRPAGHWDILLDQMKWLRTDFREERKWKYAAALKMADACAEWVVSDQSTRAMLQVRVSPVGRSNRKTLTTEPIDADTVNKGHHQPDSNTAQLLHDTPDLVPSTALDSPAETPSDSGSRFDFALAKAPAGLFSLPAESVTFTIEPTPVSDKLLSELPLYEAPGDNIAAGISSDSVWQSPIVPTSKYIGGKLTVRQKAVPQKKSRFEFEEEEEDTLDSMSSEIKPALALDGAPEAARPQRTPEQTNVALFDPEHKHIRDRIHAGHAFRPPSEYPMPLQTFFECRQSSQWTWTEDDKLRALVKEYSYNWSLISDILSSRSTFSSGAERRTPWECFERWISLEGLPADMQKTQYFRTYHGRLELAQRTLMAQPQPAQQQSAQQPQQSPQQSGSQITPVRRRTAQPVRVERRKNTKYLALIDAMRKLAKKRETTLQKQQHAAGMAAQRKANVEAQPSRAPVRTPQDFSRMKYEREVKIQEKIQERTEAYRQQVLAQQRVAMQSRSLQQNGPPSGIPSATAQQMSNGLSNAVHPSAGHAGGQLPPGHPQGIPPGQGRPHPISQNLPNGLHNHSGGVPANMAGNVAMGLKGLPQPAGQAGVSAHQRHQPQMPQDMRVLMETNRIQQEQRRYLQQQQQQQHQHQQQQHAPHQHQHQSQQQYGHQQQTHGQQGPSSSPNMNQPNGFPNASMQNNPAMLAALQAASNASNMPNPAANGVNGPIGASGSPRMGQNGGSLGNVPQQLSSGMIPAINSISHQVKTQNPGASPEQIRSLTNEQLVQYQHRINQAAMNAAAGGGASPGAVMASMGSLPNQQIYAQMLRAQQANQRAQQANQAVRPASTGPNGVRAASRSATPQTHRSGSAQIGQGPDQSPRPPQAQMAGGK